MGKDIVLKFVEHEETPYQCTDVCVLNRQKCGGPGTMKCVGGTYQFKKQYQPVSMENTKAGDIVYLNSNIGKKRKILAMWKDKDIIYVITEKNPTAVIRAENYVKEVSL
jgi:hypothetical protein